MIYRHDGSPRLTREFLELEDIVNEGFDANGPRFAVTLKCHTAEVTIHNVLRSQLIEFTEAVCYDIALYKRM